MAPEAQQPEHQHPQWPRPPGPLGRRRLGLVTPGHVVVPAHVAPPVPRSHGEKRIGGPSFPTWSGSARAGGARCEWRSTAGVDRPGRNDGRRSTVRRVDHRFGLGPENAEVAAAVGEVLGRQTPGVLAVTGRSWTGKTHLLEGIGRWADVEVQSAEALVCDLVEAVSGQGRPAFDETWTRPRLVLVDGAEHLAHKHALQDAVATLLLGLLARGGSAVVTSTLGVTEPTMGPLWSRLGAAGVLAVAELRPPGRASVERILAQRLPELRPEAIRDAVTTADGDLVAAMAAGRRSCAEALLAPGT